MSKKITNFAVANGKQAAAPRRGAGVVDRGGLENRCTLTGTQGSNPCLSAKAAQSAAFFVIGYDRCLVYGRHKG